MVSGLACQNWKLFGNRSNSYFSAIFARIDPRLCRIWISLKLLLAIILHPFIIFWLRRKSHLIHRCFFIHFIFSKSKQFFLTLDLAVIIPKEDSRSKLIINEVIKLFFSLCCLTVFAEIFNRREVVHGFHWTYIFFDYDSFRFDVCSFLVHDSLQQILVNLSHSVFAQSRHNFLLLFPESSKVPRF